MTSEYKVSRVLWENFEAVLMAQSRRYIGELAKRLAVPEKELQRKVLPNSDALKILILDGSHESIQCRAYVQHDKMTTFCRKPIAHGSSFCTFHRHTRMNVIADTKPVIVEKIKESVDREPVWRVKNNIVNSKGHLVGKINPNTQTVKWFVMNE